MDREYIFTQSKSFRGKIKVPFSRREIGCGIIKPIDTDIGRRIDAPLLILTDIGIVG